MNISFGKKIPVIKCQVYDRKDNNFKSATLYEFNGQDTSDADYFIMQRGKWSNLKYNITTDIYNKTHKYHNEDENNILDKKFFSLEVEEGKSIGVCETVGMANFSDIYYLECNPEFNYKYAGQTMLAGIAKLLLKQAKPILGVCDPADSARRFYTETCGFVPQFYNSRELQMDSSQMEKFIEKVENETKTNIVDLTA